MNRQTPLSVHDMKRTDRHVEVNAEEHDSFETAVRVKLIISDSRVAGSGAGTEGTFRRCINVQGHCDGHGATCTASKLTTKSRQPEQPDNQTTRQPDRAYNVQRSQEHLL